MKTNLLPHAVFLTLMGLSSFVHALPNGVFSVGTDWGAAPAGAFYAEDANSGNGQMLCWERAEMGDAAELYAEATFQGPADISWGSRFKASVNGVPAAAIGANFLYIPLGSHRVRFSMSREDVSRLAPDIDPCLSFVGYYPINEVSLDAALELSGAWSFGGPVPWRGYASANGTAYAAAPVASATDPAWLERSITGPFYFKGNGVQTYVGESGVVLTNWYLEADGRRITPVQEGAMTGFVQVPAGSTHRYRWVILAAGSWQSPIGLDSVTLGDPSQASLVNSPAAIPGLPAYAGTTALKLFVNQPSTGHSSAPAFNVRLYGPGKVQYEFTTKGQVGDAHVAFYQARDTAGLGASVRQVITNSGELTLMEGANELEFFLNRPGAPTFSGEVSFAITSMGGSPYQAWQQAQAFPSFAGDSLADPDSDGTVNGLEFLFGTNPLVSGPSALAVEKTTHNRMSLQVPRAAHNTAGSQLQLEISPNLQGWLPAPASAEVSPPSGIQRLYQVPVTPGQNQFLRLKAIVK